MTQLRRPMAAVLGLVVLGVAATAWYRGALPPYPDAAAPMPEPDFVNRAIADPRFLALAAGAGIVGGVFYWLTAGRWAGGWRGPDGGRPTSPAP